MGGAGGLSAHPRDSYNLEEAASVSSLTSEMRQFPYLNGFRQFS